MTSRPALSIVLLSTALASSASAQDCAEGRERVLGRCCWPGQTWSDERARCEGAPRCPEGLVEHGDACIASVTTPASPPGEVAPPTGYGYGDYAPWTPASTAASTEGWPLSDVSPTAPTSRAIAWRGEDEPLVALAFAVFDIGWVLGWVGAIVDEAIQGCRSFTGFTTERHSCDSWPLTFVPLVGSLLASLTHFDGDRHDYVSMGHGIASLILQFVGLIAIPISLANDTTETVFQPLDLGHGTRATIDLWAPGSDAGMSAMLRF